MKVSLVILIVIILVAMMLSSGCSQPAAVDIPPPPPPVPSSVSPPSSSPPTSASPTSAMPDVPVVSGRQGIDMTGFGRIMLDPDNIEVSAVYNEWGAANLLQEAGFWHVPVPKEGNEDWVVVDLGSQRRLDAISIKPREELLSQLWSNDEAILEGSDDGETWTPEYILELDHETLAESEWITFVLTDTAVSYRYYRIYVDSPGFISMAGLRIYGEGGITPTVSPTPTTPTVPDIPAVTGLQGVDTSGYGRINLDVGQVEVSRVFQEWGAANLLQEAGFWHVPVPKEGNEDWVVVDLGSRRRLDAIAIKPREDLLAQLWQDSEAVLEGSDDGETWTPEYILELDHETLAENKRITFILPDDATPYRYYRIYINSPSFISMAALRLYGEGGEVIAVGANGVDLTAYELLILEAAQLEVSAVFKDWGAANLLRDEGFWHVPVPKESNEAWVVIDLGGEMPLGAVGILPRTDLLSQLWRGGAAVFEGSNDGENWTPECVLELDHEVLAENEWITFLLPGSTAPYRYYRIYINSSEFISMAGLRLYAR